MIRIEKDVVINRPVQDVWDFVTDLRNSPQWTRSGSELRQISDGPPEVGARMESRRQLFGRLEIKSQSIVVTEWDPNHAVAYVAKVPLLGRAVQRLSFEPTGEGTRLTSTEVEVGRALRWLQTWLPRLIGSIHATELASLKRLIEATSRSNAASPGKIG